MSKVLFWFPNNNPTIPYVIICHMCFYITERNGFLFGQPVFASTDMRRIWTLIYKEIAFCVLKNFWVSSCSKNAPPFSAICEKGFCLFLLDYSLQCISCSNNTYSLLTHPITPTISQVASHRDGEVDKGSVVIDPQPKHWQCIVRDAVQCGTGLKVMYQSDPFSQIQTVTHVCFFIAQKYPNLPW